MVDAALFSMQSVLRVQTLLSSLENFTKHDVFPSHAVHPFATSAPESCGLLQDLINTTAQLSDSLHIYDASIQWTNPKLISLMRQHTSIEHASQSSAKNLHHLIDVLTKRTGVSYGENIPLLATSIPEWCVDQVKNWGTSVGMETFKDDSSTVVLGGKSLVIDVDFTISHENPLKPMLKVSNVKTSNALLAPNAHPINSSPSTSALLDGFLRDGIEKYCNEMQKDDYARDPQYAASLRRDVLDHLRYLVLLDGLASRKDDGGIRWFTDIDELWPVLNGLAISEAKVVASSLSLRKAPLDIFLLRGHSLPLPYLISPSISFLTYISPLVYLSLLRNTKTDQTTPTNDDEPSIDILLSELKSRLPTLTTGITIATLSLEKLSEAHLYPPNMSMPNVTARPTFPLVPSAADLDHSFPQLDGFGIEDNSAPPFSWVLDFTAGGKRPGVIMSQSRMKFIELVVNPLGGDGMNGVAEMLSFGTGSWVDHLLNPGNAASPERYTALYRSPNSLHPPLQLRLTAPEEPGFTLERIPVHSIKEIWGILEVVREQCWLNEILLGSHWTPEGLKSEEEDVPPDNDTTATEGELQAILTGTFVPRKIPVNVFLPTGTATDNLFELAPVSGLKIVMTSPARLPISGLIEITVTLDENKPRGIAVDVQGAMGYDLKPVELEEICRRGGTLGLSGRVWASGGGSSR